MPISDNDKAFLGVGWAFPVDRDRSGEVSTVAYEDDIRQSIRIILGTRPGERVMRPDFGAGIYALLFEPMNGTTMALAKHHVEEALIAWEPRIDTITVDVTGDPTKACLTINIQYRVRSTNTFYNMVYPFYLMEGERQ